MEGIVLKKLLLMIMLLCSFAVSACGSEPEAEKLPPATAVFETNMGNFEIALATDLAPNTCKILLTLPIRVFTTALFFIVLLIIL